MEVLKRKCCVPWISMDEWYEVYKNIFSNAEECQLNAYERMLVWKSRHPTLPSGIECTLCLIQVCLRDREISSQIHSGTLASYVENDLRLMYSTAIMRFLNHLSSIAQSSEDTLFKIAKKLHIPEWMVSLRHDTAHGFSLPSLSVLHLATSVALDWVHEYYWRDEAATTTDWVLEETLPADGEDQNAEEIKELMDVWQALKLHISSGYVTVSDLQDLELRKYVEIFTRKKERSNSHGTAVSFTSQTVEERKGKGAEVAADDLICDPVESHNLTYVVSILMHKLLKLIKQRRTKEKNKEVVDIIVERDTFLPSGRCMELFDKPEEDAAVLPKRLFFLWNDLLSSLHKSYSILPHLLHKLILIVNDEDEGLHRRKLAAAWVKELGNGAVKVRRILQVMDCWERKGQHFIGEKIRNKHLPKKVAFSLQRRIRAKQKKSKPVIYKLVKDEIEKESPDLKSVLPLKITHVPDSMCSMELIKQTILKPNTLTEEIISSLADLVIPPLSDSAKGDLLSLVHIYTSEKVLSSNEDEQVRPIHTVEELTQSETRALEIVNDGMLFTEDNSNSLSEVPGPIWTRGAAYASWSTCPLGLLPWQRDRTATPDIPVNVTWQPLQLAQSAITEGRNKSELFKLKINWASVVKKRPKKSLRKLIKRSKKNANLMKSAFHALLQVG